MNHVPFILACLMLSYDASGHLFAVLARISGERGAYYWNNYSTYIWPRIIDPTLYDLYWATWHFITIVLFVLSYFIHGTTGNTIEIQRWLAERNISIK